MNPHLPEPLDDEEREFARLIARTGPQGEPSPTLDARILAAAHDAVRARPQPRRKPRWPVAMGLAASVVFAVGIAWQLRPLQQAPTVSADTPAAEAVEPSQPLAMVEAPDSEAAAADAASAAVASMPPAKSIAPPPAESEAPGTGNVAGRGEARPAYAPPAEARRAAPPRQAPGEASRGYVGDVILRRGSPVPPVATPGTSTASAPAPVFAPPAPPPPPSPSAAADEAPAAFSPEPSRPDAFARGQMQGNAGLMEAAPSDADGTTLDRVEVTGSRVESPRAKAAARREARLQETRQRESERSSEQAKPAVTGSRLKRTDLQVPVSDDARLPVSEWLERVRTRYGLGDEGAAKQSLLLFVKDHPGEPVPGDLEPLLEE